MQIYEKMRKMKPAPLLFGKKGHQNFRIPLSKIQYIEIAKRGSIIQTYENGEKISYTSNMKVSEHFRILEDYGFAYAHNSYIVSFSKDAASIINRLAINGIGAPVREGYTFEGWCDAPVQDSYEDGEWTLAAGATLYAAKDVAQATDADLYAVWVVDVDESTDQ